MSDRRAGWMKFERLFITLPYTQKKMKKKLKIGIMVAGEFTTPQPKGMIYAPITLAKSIAEELTRKGHKVYFFAPKGSQLKVTKIISGNLDPLRIASKKGGIKIISNPCIKIISDYYVSTLRASDSFTRWAEVNKILNLWDQYLISLAYEMAIEKKLDILHIHPVDRALPFGMAFKKIPIVYTLHEPIYPWLVKVYNMFQSKNQHFVSISNAQRKPAPNLNYASTIYNGLDSNLFPFSQRAGNYCLFIGRLVPEKGVHEAILAARKAKEKLIIVGAPNKGEYWEKKIKPFLGKNIKYAGCIPHKKTYKYYQEAKALLCPIQWEEPFGLTFTEAMSCGTPVIAFDRGSVKEIVQDGKTGFIVKNVGEMARAIKKIGEIKREDCRKRVEEKFTNKKMVDNYEKVFYKILRNRH